jgi:hypothetical protein
VAVSAIREDLPPESLLFLSNKPAVESLDNCKIGNREHLTIWMLKYYEGEEYIK